MASLTAPDPPRMTMLAGSSRSSSAKIVAGMPALATGSTGPPSTSAAGPPASASA
jgi:hypothetical protein